MRFKKPIQAFQNVLKYRKRKWCLITRLLYMITMILFSVRIAGVAGEHDENTVISERIEQIISPNYIN